MELVSEENWNAAFEAVKTYHRTTKSNQIFPPREKRFSKFTNWVWKVINMSMPSDFRASRVSLHCSVWFAGVFAANKCVERGIIKCQSFKEKLIGIAIDEKKTIFHSVFVGGRILRQRRDQMKRFLITLVFA